MSSNPVSLDALIIGAGFSGMYQLRHLRDAGFNARLVDSASDYGGVWYWNRYPGARVDSEIPVYEFSDPLLWKNWTWKQRFPGGTELREYFAYVADKWDLRKDTQFNTFVSGASWDNTNTTWTVSTRDGNSYSTKYLLLCTGFTTKPFIPDWKGIDNFRGVFLHPARWPKVEPDLQGKRIAVIGVGATAVQIIQELAQVAGQLVVFQRTPSFATPMKQINFQHGEQVMPKDKYPALFDARKNTFNGFQFTFMDRNTLDDSAEERQATMEALWAKGDLSFWLATYKDIIEDKDANREAYDFWKKKVRARIQDPIVQELLAPEAQPFSFGCKRVPLENGYYEAFNQENVCLVDVNRTPILNITGQGVLTAEKEWELDYIIFATGFDAITVGLTQIDIRGTSGQSLSDKWRNGVKTYLGMAVAGFPNMFFTSGPQAPTAFANGPTCAEFQGDFIVQMLKDLRTNGFQRIEAREDAENQWVEDIHKFVHATLPRDTKSWYVADNIPSKSCMSNNYVGFKFK